MKLTDVVPVLWTESLAHTIDFYTQMLGFTCDESVDEWGWASLSRDGAQIMLAKPNEHTPKKDIGFSGSFYFRTDDVLLLWNHLKDKVNICYPLDTFPWGMQEFAIYDNNGYILQFGQDIANE